LSVTISIKQFFKLQRQEELSHSTEAEETEVPNSKALYIDCEVEMLMTSFLVDTGSTISIIKKETWDKINKNKPHLRLELTILSIL
jgi:hypothetical protein